jgi:HEAT repeat protein
VGKTRTKLILISCAVIFLISAIAYISFRNTRVAEISESPEIAEHKGAKTSVIPASQKLPAQENLETSTDSGKGLEFNDSALEALSDPDVTARVQAVLRLRKHPSPEAVDLLSRFLDDEDIAVVSQAINTLGVIGSNRELEDLVCNLLEEKARDKEFSARGQALVTASMVGRDDRILPVISDFISEEDDTGRDPAVRAMSFIASPECIPFLRKVLNESEDREIQENAFHILTKIDTAEAFDLLQKQLVSLDEKRQASATWALSVHNRPEFNEALTEAMANNTLRRDAVIIVATSRAAPAVFSELLQQDDISKQDKISWLKIMAENTIDSPSAVRSGVASAVEPLLNSDDTDLEIQAIKTLGGLGAELDTTAFLLAPKFQSSTLEVRKAALDAFYSYCTPNTYKELEYLWWDEDEKIRRTSFSLSERFLDFSDQEALEKATKHEDEFISKHSKSIVDQLF